MIDVEATAAVAGIGLSLMSFASAFSYFIGKLSQRIDSEKELVNVKFNNNKDEHNAILKASEKHTEVLEEVQECMHKMQGGKEC